MMTNYTNSPVLWRCTSKSCWFYFYTFVRLSAISRFA